MPALSPGVVRPLVASAALLVLAVPALPAAAQTAPSAPLEAGEREVPPTELGITSSEVGPAEAGESAQAVPYTGTHEVWCTQSNPSPGVCAGHHSYPAIDLGMPVGTTVNASGPGVVQEARSSDSDARGLYVTIRHPDGIYSRYLHLSAVTVRVGQTVDTGAPLGRSGSTGSSTAPHLHYDEQQPLGTPKSVGVMVGRVGVEQVTYPNAFGYTTWSSVPYGTDMRNDSYTSPTPVTPRQWGGPSVATGDFNGDGFDDLAGGVPGRDAGEALEAGAVVVASGSARGITTTGSRQFVPGSGRLTGNAEAGDLFGAAVAAGDFNGDGYDDLAVGAPREDTEGGADTGAVLVIPGSPDGLRATRSRQRWSGAGGLPGGAGPGDQLGAALAAGDFDGDGVDDLAIGVPGDDAGAADAGAAIVAPGTANGITGAGGRQLISGLTGLAGTAQRGDLLGAAVAAGDFDGDGHDDLAIGSPGQDVGAAPNAGQVIVALGGAGGIDRAASRQVRAGVGGVTGRSERDDIFGTSLAVGDVDGVAPADLVVGVPGEDAAATNDGAVALILGSPLGLTGTGSRQYWSGSNGSAGVARDGDLLGAAVALGDVDADGEVEVLAGAPGKDVGAVREAGAVLVIGTVDGVLTSDSPNVAGTAETDDRFGRSVATGDVNGDSLADLVVAAPTETESGLAAAGALTVVRGHADGGLTGAGSAHLVRGVGGLAGAARADDHFGGLLPPYLF